MTQLDFSLPYNNNSDTLEELFKLQGFGGSNIHEIYLSCPQEYSGSGRVTPRFGEKAFFEVINLIHKRKIRANLILNPTCQGADWYSEESSQKILDFIARMHEDYGVEAITLANPVYIQEVKKRLPQMEVCASVLSDIDCLQRAVIIREAGADTITPDANINRNIELLKQIKKVTGFNIKIMVNEGCLYRCPYRKFHFNFVSHWSKELEHSTMKGQDFFDYCLNITAKDHSQILKSGWIRPEDLQRYSEVTSYFKVVGRTRPGSLVLRASKAYMGQEYDGNLLDIICSSLGAFGLRYGAYIDNKELGESGFFDRVTSCNFDCYNCGFCQKMAERLVKLNVVTRGKLEDLGRHELADKLEAAGKLPHFG